MNLKVYSRCLYNQSSKLKKTALIIIAILSTVVLLSCIFALLTLISWGIGIPTEGFDNPTTFFNSFRFTFMFTVFPFASILIPFLSLCSWYYGEGSLVKMFNDFFRTSPFSEGRGFWGACILMSIMFGLYYIWATLYNFGFQNFLRKDSATSFEEHLKIALISGVFVNILSILTLFANIFGFAVLIGYCVEHYYIARQQLDEETSSETTVGSYMGNEIV